MRVLVTGSNGLVGSRLSRLLVSQGHQVLGISRGARAPGASGDYGYAPVELTDLGQVDRAVEAFAPEAIVNTVAMTEVDACEKEPERAFRINCVAAANVATAARRAGAHLVHVSTDYVFDGDHGPYSEEDVPNPRGTYAISKHMGEEAVRTIAGSWTIARTAVVYGWPRAQRPNFGAWLVGALGEGKGVKLFSDQIVTPSLADNVAEMVAELATRRLPGVYHTAGAEPCDRVSFGQKLCAVFGFDPALITPSKLADLKLASPRPLHSALTTRKVSELLSAKPLGIDEQLRRFHAAWRADEAKTTAAA